MLLPRSNNIRSHLQNIHLPGLFSDREQGGFLLPGYWHLYATLYATLITCCTQVLIIRTLGPDDFGIFAFVQWLGALVIPLIGIGASAPANQHIAGTQSHEAPRLVAGIFYFLWCRQCRHIGFYILACLILVTPVAWFFHIPSRSLLLLGSLSGLPLLFSNIAGVTLRGQQRSDLLLMLQIFGAFVSFLLVVVALHIDGERIGIFLLARAIADTLTLVMAMICVLRLLPVSQAHAPSPLFRERLVRKIRNSPLFFLIDAIVWQRSELLLLALWYRPAYLGFYALGALLSSWLMSLIPLLFSTFLAPLCTQLLLVSRAHWLCSSPQQQFIRTSCAMAVLAFLLCGLIILLCPFLIQLCLGPEFLEAIVPFRILLVSAAFGSVASVSTTYLATYQQHPLRLRLGLCAAILNILLAVLLTPYWGLSGAAIASASAQILSAVGSILLCHISLKKQVALVPKEV